MYKHLHLTFHFAIECSSSVLVQFLLSKSRCLIFLQFVHLWYKLLSKISLKEKIWCKVLSITEANFKGGNLNLYFLYFWTINFLYLSILLPKRMTLGKQKSASCSNIRILKKRGNLCFVCLFVSSFCMTLRPIFLWSSFKKRLVALIIVNTWFLFNWIQKFCSYIHTYIE